MNDAIAKGEVNDGHWTKICEKVARNWWGHQSSEATSDEEKR